MNRQVSGSYRRRVSHPLFWALAVIILLTGLTAQAVMQVRISRQNRAAYEMQSEIAGLSATIANLEHSISQYHDLARIGNRAEQLGMSRPTENQVRVVNVARVMNNSLVEAE